MSPTLSFRDFATPRPDETMGLGDMGSHRSGLGNMRDLDSAISEIDMDVPMESVRRPSAQHLESGPRRVGIHPREEILKSDDIDDDPASMQEMIKRASTQPLCHLDCGDEDLPRSPIRRTSNYRERMTMTEAVRVMEASQAIPREFSQATPLDESFSIAPVPSLTAARSMPQLGCHGIEAENGSPHAVPPETKPGFNEKKSDAFKRVTGIPRGHRQEFCGTEQSEEISRGVMEPGLETRRKITAKRGGGFRFPQAPFYAVSPEEETAMKAQIARQGGPWASKQRPLTKLEESLLNPLPNRGDTQPGLMKMSLQAVQQRQQILSAIPKGDLEAVDRRLERQASLDMIASEYRHEIEPFKGNPKPWVEDALYPEYESTTESARGQQGVPTFSPKVSPREVLRQKQGAVFDLDSYDTSRKSVLATSVHCSKCLGLYVTWFTF